MEVMKVADLNANPTSFSQIKQQKTIKRIDDILRLLQWQDRELPTNGDPDYSFWLEHKGVSLRVTNYELWLDEPNSVIIDHVKLRYAYISGEPLRELVDDLK
ncbi:hypothetical protein [Paenibacillus sp. 1011MAR3C5]|uniref:hypothetical protein n=1 Tax=Paenibacillus sp. 1011MAR3C5 TaxID=1675787 RepID=UPI0011C37DE0|nr:hypothetical protein [Paenibacillus sp. 1011MAR3C5]